MKTEYVPLTKSVWQPNIVVLFVGRLSVVGSPFWWGRVETLLWEGRATTCHMILGGGRIVPLSVIPGGKGKDSLSLAGGP